MTPPVDGRLRVLITGATSGIGRELAVQLGARGWRVAVTGRREDKLRETEAAVLAAGGECLALAGSVAEPDAVKAHYAAIKSRWGGLDWAVLNAAVNDAMNARQFKTAAYRWTFETNVFGTANWLEAVIPDMVAEGRGTIVGVSSIAAWRGLPNSGPYCASKAALSAMLESARVDLRGSGVRVVTVCPGYVKSEMTARNDPKEMLFLMEVEDAARAIISGAERGKSLIHFPWQLSLPSMTLLANLPNGIYDRIAARIKRSKKPYLDASRAR